MWSSVEQNKVWPQEKYCCPGTLCRWYEVNNHTLALRYRKFVIVFRVHRDWMLTWVYTPQKFISHAPSFYSDTEPLLPGSRYDPGRGTGSGLQFANFKFLRWDRNNFGSWFKGSWNALFRIEVRFGIDYFKLK